MGFDMLRFDMQGGTQSEYENIFTNFAACKKYSSQVEYPYHNEVSKP